MVPLPLKQVQIIPRQVLGVAKLGIRYSVVPGVSLFGYNVYWEGRRMRPRSSYALEYALALKARTVLDVGSGDGSHARAFRAAGAQVTCVDFGTSIYARQSASDISTLHIDFNKFEPRDKYELV